VHGAAAELGMILFDLQLFAAWLATNGVVHVIDRVLLPPSKTIAQLAEAATMAATPEFTILVAALARTSGTADDLLAAAGNADAALTVFAPTDAAFNTLLGSLNMQSIDEVPLADLVAILKHHIVGARVFSTDLTDGAVTTLNGDVTISDQRNNYRWIRRHSKPDQFFKYFGNQWRNPRY